MKNKTKKLVCIVMSVCLIATGAPLCSPIASAAKSSSTQASQEQRKEELEKQLAETDKKLKELGKKKKDAQEYLDVIDTKLDTLKQQYSITQDEVEQTQNRVNKTEQSIKTNTITLANIETDLTKMEAQAVELESDYRQIQDRYYQRMRAIYISGETESVLSFLLSSNGISSFLTRLEMVSAISRSDSRLMRDITDKIGQIQQMRTDLGNKQEELNKTQKILQSDTESLKIQQATLSVKEDEMKEKKTAIENQQKEANAVLQQINDKTKEYSELHDMTQEEINKIDREIEEAIKKYKDSLTTTKKPSTTKKPTTTKPSGNEENTEKETEETTQSTSSSEYINMTYPCPAYTKITCAFNGYPGHKGCDFSTGGTTGHKIVAVDSGMVIVSKDITCDRSTCKKSYHGSGYCSYGRYIVIMHDKPNKNGETVYTLYAHNSSRSVSEGQHVNKGQQIALSGSTGNSTGPHLHFEVRLGNGSYSDAVNPAYYLP